VGREVRKVTADWQHPKEQIYDYRTGKIAMVYTPLLDNYAIQLEDFRAMIESDGLVEALEYYGGGPVKHDYMLADVPDEERTHLMMYEDTTEGTPISPAFETAEELARWLADNNASANGGTGASYEAWLEVCKGGWAPSLAWSPETGLISGVEAAKVL
jgi:hypothetical protein